MDNGVNFPAVFIADMLGMMTLAILFFGNIWRLREKDNRQNQCLYLMIVTTFISCAADLLGFYLLGKPGTLNFALIYITSAWSFAMNMVLGVLWVMFLSYQLNGSVSKRRLRFLIIVSTIGFIFLIVNIFKPIIFQVDSNNNYSRAPLSIMYLAIQFVYMIDGVVMYYRSQKQGGLLKVFPLGVFLLPVAIGIVVQSVFYGVSTIWPCAAIAVGGVVAGAQIEQFFRDSLTGIYNRTFLDYLKLRHSTSRLARSKFTAVMIDLNDFKDINDTYGHATGDQAVKDAADIFVRIVGSRGTVIRYAGDEFFILLNILDQNEVNKTITLIRHEMDKFNETSKRPYTLSCAIGSAQYDFKSNKFDEMFDEIDAKMYEDKKKYYANRDHDRRKHFFTSRK